MYLLRKKKELLCCCSAIDKLYILLSHSLKVLFFIIPCLLPPSTSPPHIPCFPTSYITSLPSLPSFHFFLHPPSLPTLFLFPIIPPPRPAHPLWAKQIDCNQCLRRVRCWMLFNSILELPPSHKTHKNNQTTRSERRRAQRADCHNGRAVSERDR